MEFKTQLKWKKDSKTDPSCKIQNAHCPLTKMHFTVFPESKHPERMGHCGYSIEGAIIEHVKTEEQAKEICETARIERVLKYVQE